MRGEVLAKYAVGFESWRRAPRTTGVPPVFAQRKTIRYLFRRPKRRSRRSTGVTGGTPVVRKSRASFSGHKAIQLNWEAAV